MSTSGRMSGYALGRVGALIGLGLGLAYAAMMIADQITSREGGALFAFPLSYVAPYLAALLAARIADVDLRISVWVGAGILSFLLAFSSFGGVTLPLLVPAVLLIRGAWRTHREAGCRPPLGAVAFSLTMVAAGIGSFVLAVLLRAGDVSDAAISAAPWAITLCAVLGMALRHPRSAAGA